MNHLSRQAGLIAFLAAAVTTTSMAERSSSECTDGDNDNYFSKLLFAASYPGGCGDFGTDPDTPCLPTVCPDWML